MEGSVTISLRNFVGEGITSKNVPWREKTQTKLVSLFHHREGSLEWQKQGNFKHRTKQ